MTGRAHAGRLLDLLLPASCLGCSARLPLERSDALICQGCRTRLRPLPSPGCPRCGFPLGTARAPSRPCGECREWPPVLVRARSACVLAPPADALVHALKYGGWKELSELMAAPMARTVRADPGFSCNGLLVPVPTTPRRERRRGYNQASLLARALARRVGGEVALLLERRRKGGTQVALHPRQRAANVQSAFRPRPGAAARIRGASVVLVDDVLTTGATAGAAATALESAGVGSVSLATFARALPGRDR